MATPVRPEGSSEDMLDYHPHHPHNHQKRKNQIKSVQQNFQNLQNCQEEDGDPVIVGFDAEQLYPSLEQVSAAREAYLAIMESPIKFDGINYKEGLKYIAVNSSDHELQQSGLRRVLPWKAGTKGRAATITGAEALGPRADREIHWKFRKGVELTDKEKKEIVAHIVKIGVNTMFSTHVYTFGGKYYNQRKGGPIGLRATGAVARVMMGRWDQKVMSSMEANNIRTLINKRYMDDIRNLLKAIRAGWRWSGCKLEFSQEWEEEDLPMSRTK